MKKIITLFLLLLILAIIIFFILRFGLASTEDNFFNKNFRSFFAKYPIARYILALHFDGDAKTDYLGNKFGKILIEVDTMDGMEISTHALDILKEKIQAVTKKPVEYIESDSIIPYKETVTDQDLQKLHTLYRNYYIKNNEAILYLLVVSLDADKSTYMGSTLNEDGLVLYRDQIKIFTQDSPSTLSNYEESTILHEFGHQIGLPHNNEPKCLMNESAEMAHVAQERPIDVVVDFCDYEKELINNR